jgi:hypothetical protein
MPSMELYRNAPESADEEILGAERPATVSLRTDEERLARVHDELAAGFAALEGIGPAVSVFGSARVPEGDPRYELARTVGRKLAEAGLAGSPAGGRG